MNKRPNIRQVREALAERGLGFPVTREGRYFSFQLPGRRIYKIDAAFGLETIMEMLTKEKQ